VLLGLYGCLLRAVRMVVPYGPYVRVVCTGLYWRAAIEGERGRASKRSRVAGPTASSSYSPLQRHPRGERRTRAFKSQWLVASRPSLSYMRIQMRRRHSVGHSPHSCISRGRCTNGLPRFLELRGSDGQNFWLSTGWLHMPFRLPQNRLYSMFCSAQHSISFARLPSCEIREGKESERWEKWGSGREGVIAADREAGRAKGDGECIYIGHRTAPAHEASSYCGPAVPQGRRRLPRPTDGQSPAGIKYHTGLAGMRSARPPSEARRQPTRVTGDIGPSVGPTTTHRRRIRRPYMLRFPFVCTLSRSPAFIRPIDNYFIVIDRSIR